MKKKIILITLLFFSFLILSSCFFGNNTDNTNNNTNNNNNDDNEKIISYNDEFGIERFINNNGIWCENLILNNNYYNNFKDSIIGKGGKSGLVNSTMLNYANKDINNNELNYFITVIYSVNDRIPDLVTYFKATLINENNILFDSDAIETEQLIIKNYRLVKDDYSSYGDVAEVYLDMSKDSYDKISINIRNDSNPHISFFSFIIPFVIKEEGNFDLDYSISDNNSTFDHHEKINAVIGDYDIQKLATISNYKVSFISESLCKDGNIDDNKLSNKSNFVKNYAKYMVVDFDTKAVEDNDGKGKINVLVQTSKYELFKTNIEDVPSTEFSEEVLDNKNNMKVSLSIPRENNSSRHYRLIYRLLPIGEENSDIQIFITSKNITIDDYKMETFLAKVTNDGLVYNDYNEIVETLVKDINEINIPATHNGEKVSIGANAFEDCTELVTVNIEDGVESIGENAFLNCTSLENINFPSSLKNIYSNAFDNCNNNLFNQYDGSLYIGNDNNDYYIFLKPLNKNLKEYRINANTEIICSGAFVDCTVLENLNLFNVKKISDYAFKNCQSLTNISLNGVTSIGKNAFIYCDNLRTINLPNSLTDIEDYAFNRSGIKTITIPSNVSNCGNDIFNDCSSLEGVVLNNDIIDFNEIRLSNYTLSNLKYIFFKGSYDIANRFESKDIKIEYESDVKKLEYIFNNDYSYLKTDTGIGVNFKILNTNIINVTIPEVITTIESRTFENCNRLIDVTLPSNLKTIDSYAFNNCRLIKNITIPNSVININESAFSNCDSLEKIIIPSNVEKISTGAFYGCSSLKNVEIKDGVKEIEDNAFFNCSSLENIIIPDNVLKMGNSIFKGCNELKSLSIPFVGQRRLDDDSGNFTLKYLLGYTYPGTLKEIILTDSADIPSNAFSGYESIEKIVLKKDIASIGKEAFYNCTSLKYLELPNEISNIALDSFNGCEALTDIYFDGNIKNWCNIKFYSETSTPMKYATNLYFKNELGNVSFNNNKYSLVESIVVPSDVNAIGNYQFNGISRLKDITILNSNANFGIDALDNCDLLKDFYYNGDIADWFNLSFSYNNNFLNNIYNFYYLDDEGNINNNGYKYKLLEELEIPDTIEEIGDYQFNGLVTLKKVIFGPNVKKMNDFAFANCDALKDIYYNGSVDDWCGIEFETSDANPRQYVDNIYFKINNAYNILSELEIPDTVTEIGRSQFSNFKELTSVIIHNNVNKIGKYSFNGCDNLAKMVLPFIGSERQSSITTNPTNINHIFGTNVPAALKEISITDSTYLPENALKACKSIEKINLSDNLKFIAKNAFYGCEALTEIILPNGTLTLGEGAFFECKMLENITIPNTLSTINKNAFYGCEKLNNVILPQNIEVLEEGVFNGCKTLETIIMPNTIKILSKNLFSYCISLNDVTLGNNVTEISSGAFGGCTSLASINLPNTLTTIGDSAFSSCTSLNNVTIPNNTLLGDYVFYNCTSLTNIELPESLTSINNYLFNKCSGLISITIPNAVESIGNGAFKECSALENIILSNSLKYIGKNAFESCSKLSSILLPDTVSTIDNNAFANCIFENINLSVDLKTLGKNVFDNCINLINIFIPESLKNVGNDAFLNCDSLENVYYGGNVTTWANIMFGSDNISNINSNPMSNAKKLYLINSNGNVNYNGNIYSLLEELIIPDTYNYLNNYNFINLETVKRVVVPNTILSIDEGFFKGYSSLESISLPYVGAREYKVFEKFNGSIQTVAEYDYYPLGYIFGTSYYSESEKIVQNYVARNATEVLLKNYKTYYIPSNLKEVRITKATYIPPSAFWGLKNIENVYFDSNIKVIGEYAFRDCTSLKSLTISSTIEHIGICAFYNYSGIIDFASGTKMTVIEENAFSSYKGTTIILPSSIKKTEQNAFSSSRLESIKLPSGFEILGKWTFINCGSLKTVYLPKSLKQIDANPLDGCVSLTNVYYQGSSNDFVKISGNGYINSNKITYNTY